MIQFHGDQEERLRPGEIEIYSELGSARPKDFGAGAMTTFITRHHAGDPVTVAGSSEGARHQFLQGRFLPGCAIGILAWTRPS